MKYPRNMSCYQADWIIQCWIVYFPVPVMKELQKKSARIEIAVAAYAYVYKKYSVHLKIVTQTDSSLLICFIFH